MLEFYVLVLYPAVLLGLFISPIAPLVVSLGFSIQGIISSTTWESLTTVSLLYKNQHEMDQRFKVKPLSYEATRTRETL